MSWYEPGPKEIGMAILMFTLATLIAIWRIVFWLCG